MNYQDAAKVVEIIYDEDVDLAKKLFHHFVEFFVLTTTYEQDIFASSCGFDKRTWPRIKYLRKV